MLKRGEGTYFNVYCDDNISPQPSKVSQNTLENQIQLTCKNFNSRSVVSKQNLSTPAYKNDKLPRSVDSEYHQKKNILLENDKENVDVGKHLNNQTQKHLNKKSKTSLKNISHSKIDNFFQPSPLADVTEAFSPQPGAQFKITYIRSNTENAIDQARHGNRSPIYSPVTSPRLKRSTPSPEPTYPDSNSETKENFNLKKEDFENIRENSFKMFQSIKSINKEYVLKEKKVLTKIQCELNPLADHAVNGTCPVRNHKQYESKLKSKKEIKSENSYNVQLKEGKKDVVTAIHHNTDKEKRRVLGTVVENKDEPKSKLPILIKKKTDDKKVKQQSMQNKTSKCKAKVKQKPEFINLR